MIETYKILTAQPSSIQMILAYKWWFEACYCRQHFPSNYVLSNRASVRQRNYIIHKPMQPHLHQIKPVDNQSPDILWHLDLKGGAPRLNVLNDIIALSVSAGATGILIEWEDMFPYHGPIANLSAHNAIKISDVQDLMQVISMHGLKVVHLIQTLGHLEFALKLSEWESLRESYSPAEACPSNKGTIDLVKEMVDQVLTVAPTSIVHIGADEVYHMGTCNLCLQTGNSRMELFVNHVSAVASHIHEQWGARVLVWDDMFRNARTKYLRSLASLVEPVVWAYGPNVQQMISYSVFATYARYFPSVWVAPAFKGATGPSSIMPNAARSAENTLAWQNVAKDVQKKMGLKISGTVLTGWSRYDHFAVLCELLPPSLPSLILTLLVANAQHYTSRTSQDLHFLLKCPSHIYLDPVTDIHLWKARECSFVGANMIQALLNFSKLRKEIWELEAEIKKGGWLTQYHVRYKYSSPSRVKEATLRLPTLESKLMELWDEIIAVMDQYYDSATLEEWSQQNLQPLNYTLSQIRKDAQTILSQKSWIRRPL
ncbi:unnamed protein product, partial [Meganyctiphanes norvegica]